MPDVQLAGQSRVTHSARLVGVSCLAGEQSAVTPTPRAMRLGPADARAASLVMAGPNRWRSALPPPGGGVRVVISSPALLLRADEVIE
jgi:hypothetical protein